MRTACEEDARELGDEQRETNADGCDERGLVLLRGEHEDGEDELGREEHFADWKVVRMGFTVAVMTITHTSHERQMCQR